MSNPTPPRPARAPRAALGATGRRPFAGKRMRADYNPDLHRMTVHDPKSRAYALCELLAKFVVRDVETETERQANPV